MTEAGNVTGEMVPVKRSELRLTRRGRAKATHWRIVKAAYQLFCEQGYEGTTMAQVAATAGVAVQTVYFVFHTKAALLSRAYDFAVMGEEEPQIPEQQVWSQAMSGEPEVTQAIRHFVTGVGEIARRIAPLYLVAQVAADGDPDTARVMDFRERWRVDGYRETVQLLSTKAPLRPGLSLERATDLLLLYVGPDVYRFLVEGRGWSHDEWVDWTAAALATELFGLIPPASQAR